MCTNLSVRGVLVLPLVVAAVFGAFACTGSPTQPDLIADTATGSRPRSFDESSPFSPTQVAQDEFAEQYAEELTDESELIEDAGDVEEVDATDLGASNFDASGFEPHSLTASTSTAAATAGSVALTGVIKDKRTGRVIAGVKVNVTGVPSATSNSKGYRINVPKGTRTLKFSKNGYATTSVTRTVTGPMMINVSMTATTGAALSSVVLSGNDVPVGTVVNGTVTLNNAAPSGGAKISLSSTSPATASVVSSMTIQGGKKTGTFQVNAKAAGTAVIKATYNNASKTANFKVTGGGGQNPPPPATTTPPPPPANTTPVAKFDYSPIQCLVVANTAPVGGVLATCTFDASDSTAPPGSTYNWTFPGGNVFNRTTAKFSDVPLPCGTLPNSATITEPILVTLTVTTSSGVVSSPRAEKGVTFKKNNLC